MGLSRFFRLMRLAFVFLILAQVCGGWIADSVAPDAGLDRTKSSSDTAKALPDDHPPCEEHSDGSHAFLCDAQHVIPPNSLGRLRWELRPAGPPSPFLDVPPPIPIHAIA